MSRKPTTAVAARKFIAALQRLQDDPDTGAWLAKSEAGHAFFHAACSFAAAFARGELARRRASARQRGRT
jgi:hypothetical protein